MTPLQKTPMLTNKPGVEISTHKIDAWKIVEHCAVETENPSKNPSKHTSKLYPLVGNCGQKLQKVFKNLQESNQ